MLVCTCESLYENLIIMCGIVCFCRDEVNKAYKHLAILLHPDKNLAPGSDEAFKAVAKAREELLKNR